MGRKSKWLISILFALLGICGIAQAQDPHYVPFYRLYSDANKDHFYTTNKQDRDNAINSLGYQDEGIEGYISSCSFNGCTPLYHYWINDLKDNFYTANATEKANLDQNPANNVYLGICAYINTSFFTNGFPLYRYYKQWPNGLGDHFYVNENQRAQAEAEGYTYENIITGYLSNFPSVPSTPTDLNATAVSSSQINLQWQDNADNETAFRIYRKIEGGAYNLQATIFDPDAESYSDTGLNPNTKYYYKIAVYNSGGESTYSNEVYAITQSNLPNPPSNLSAITISNSQINLSWQDNSSNEDGFRIYRKTEGGVYDILVTITDPNTTAYSNTGLTANTTYYYKAVAYNTAGNSDYSNETSATTSANNPGNTISLLIDDVKITGTIGGTIQIYDDDLNGSIITGSGNGNTQPMGLPNNGVDNVSNLSFFYSGDKVQGNYSWKTDVLRTGLQWGGIYLLSSGYWKNDWPQYPQATGANLTSLGGTITLTCKAKITGVSSVTALFGLGDDGGAGDNCGKNEGGPYTLTNSWTTYTIDLTGKDLSNVNGLFYYAVSEDTTPPASFNLSSPANNATVNNALPIFTWESSSDSESGVSGYKLYIDGNLVKTVDKTTTSTTIQTLLSNGLHTWYVVARNNIGLTSTSQTFNLNINVTLSPPQITSITPTSHVKGEFDLTINGTNFDGGAEDKIYYNGNYIGQGVINSRTSTKIVSHQNMGDPGVFVVKVKNSDGQLSNGVELTITENTTVDTTAPSGSITSPANGDKISADIFVIKATASDNQGGSGVKKVRFFIHATGKGNNSDWNYDGFWYYKDDTSSTYEITWDNTGFTSQEYTLTIQVEDNTGNIFDLPEENRVKVSYIPAVGDNPSVDNPPMVSITEPENGAIIHEITDIIVVATDDKGIAKVEFYINNELKYTANTQPYSWSWHAIKYANDLYNIKVVAYDMNGQIKEDEHRVILSRDFEVEIDGYKFENYNDTNYNDNWNQFRDAFGRNQVCNADGTPTLKALRFFNIFKDDINKSGNCFGFTVSSILFFMKKLDIFSEALTDQKVLSVNELVKNTKVNNLIEKYQWYQKGKEYYEGASKHYNPKDIYNDLKNNFDEGNINPWILVLNSHSVLPWKVEDVDASRRVIYVYDPNTPSNKDRKIYIDVINNTWKYKYYKVNEVISPITGENWGGGAATLFGVPYTAIQSIPTIRWELINIIEGDANLVFNDSLGRRLGFIDGVFVNDIPGAYYLPSISGENHRSLSTYILPTSLKYTVNIIGTADGTYNFIKVSPDGIIKLIDVKTSLNSIDQVNFTEDNDIVTYTTTENSKKYTASILKESSDENTERTYMIENATISNNANATFQVVSDGKIFEYTNTGQSEKYNLKVIQNGSNSGEFIADSIIIGSNEKHIIKPQDWDNLDKGKMEIQIDKNNDGTIDDTQVLDNGFNVNTVVYPEPTFKAYCYPNPNTGLTNIKYSIPGEGIVAVDIDIYTLTGERVYSYSEDKEAGYMYTLIWDGKNENGNILASGVYQCFIKVGLNKTCLKIAIIK